MSAAGNRSPTTRMICANASWTTSRRCGFPSRRRTWMPSWQRRRNSGGRRWNCFRTCSAPRPIFAGSGRSIAGSGKRAFASRRPWKASIGSSTPKPSTASRSRPWPRGSSFAAGTTSSFWGKAAWEKVTSFKPWDVPPARGYRVRYITSAELLQDLTASLADHTLPERLRYYSNFDLLAIDEFGFDRIERSESSQAASLLYKVVDGRTKRSTAMVTNISFEAWAEYLGDAPLAMAILDRVVDGAIVLKIEGRSYRASRVKRPVPLPHKDGKAAKQLPKPAA